jgi:hypothetical protein
MLSDDAVGICHKPAAVRWLITPFVQRAAVHNR